MALAARSALCGLSRVAAGAHRPFFSQVFPSGARTVFSGEARPEIGELASKVLESLNSASPKGDAEKAMQAEFARRYGLKLKGLTEFSVNNIQRSIKTKVLADLLKNHSETSASEAIRLYDAGYLPLHGVPNDLRAKLLDLMPLVFDGSIRSWDVGLGEPPTLKEVSDWPEEVARIYQEDEAGHIRLEKAAVKMFLDGYNNWDEKLLPQNKRIVFITLAKIFNEFPDLFPGNPNIKSFIDNGVRTACPITLRAISKGGQSSQQLLMDSLNRLVKKMDAISLSKLCSVINTHVENPDLYLNQMNKIVSPIISAFRDGVVREFMDRTENSTEKKHVKNGSARLTLNLRIFFGPNSYSFSIYQLLLIFLRLVFDQKYIQML